jgi:D-alanyl-D-alanine dipeptidase
MSETLSPSEYELNKEQLLRPIPLMEEARSRKLNYGEVPIDTANERYDEPLVSLTDYGIEGQSYYSRPNATTKDPVPGVEPDTYLRKSHAEDLKKLDVLVRSKAVTAFFGRPVCLYVQDSLRSVTLQQHLYDSVIPELIRNEHPGISDEDMAEKRTHVIAKPSTDKTKPSPHATGGAFDLEIRYQNSDGTAGDEPLEVGLTNGASDANAIPDYYEIHEPTNMAEEAIRRNRRAFYNIMTGAAFGIKTNFINNPTEWWHWGRGDQLSARVGQTEPAVYSIPEDSTATK